MTKIRRLLILFAMIISTCQLLPANDIRQLLHLLDQAIDNRQIFIDQKQTELDGLKQMLSRTPANAKFELCEEIFFLYESFNTDSARHYSDLCLEYAQNPDFGSEEKIQRAVIHQAQCLAVNGLYQQCRELLNAIEFNLAESNKLGFYRTKVLLYVWETEFSTLPGAFEASISNVLSARDSVLKYEASPLSRIQEEAIKASYFNRQAGLDLVKPVLDTISLDNPNLRYLANSAATCCESLQDEDAASYYYAMSALSDVTQGVLEHASLRKLATILYTQGDISRAYKYINCCLEDAEMCGARLRTIQMAQDLPVILEAYQLKVKNRKIA